MSTNPAPNPETSYDAAIIAVRMLFDRVNRLVQSQEGEDRVDLAVEEQIRRDLDTILDACTKLA